MPGHGLEAGITALALIDQKIPPTINLGTPGEDCILDYVANAAIDAKIDVALSNSFGFGGINASLIMRRWTEE
jgi:3-oxoacyl-[acyl-carrier-protein] synthase II